MIFFFADKPDVDIPEIGTCLEYLQKKKDYVPGQREDLGNGILCIISSYETVDETQAIWEAHKKFIDVHCVIQGAERVSVCSLAQAHVGTYHEERDYLEAKGVPMVDLQATAGTVLCLYPNDVHRTRVQISPNKSNRILKAIFKVPVH